MFLRYRSLIPLCCRTKTADGRHTHGQRPSSVRHHRPVSPPRFRRVATSKSFPKKPASPHCEAGYDSMGLSYEKPRRPFRRCQVLGASLPSGKRVHCPRRGHHDFGRMNSGQCVTTALPCAMGLTPSRLDLRPDHRSGSRRTLYSGHTPGTTCWHIDECLRELTPHTQPHPRFVIISISWLTSLDRITDQTLRYVSGPRPSIVSSSRLLGH